MPLSSMTLQIDELTVNLDGAGEYWMDETRWFDFEGIQYARTHYDAVANTGGATVSVWIMASYPTGWQWMPPGPVVGNSPELVIGAWEEIHPELHNAGDAELFVAFAGTPNASITVYWSELQFR